MTQDEKIMTLEGILRAFLAVDVDKRCSFCQKESYDEPHEDGCPFGQAAAYFAEAQE